MVTNSAKNPFDRPNPNLATNIHGFAPVRSVREKHPEDEVTSLRRNGKNSLQPTNWP
jgi:hypothetical protein